jgi:hypothetical protein
MNAFHREILLRTGSSPGHLRCRGLTGVIKDTFYPEYQYRGGTVTGDTPKRGGQGGFARGRLVDREVQRWVQDGGGKVKNPKKLHLFSRAFIALTHRLGLSAVGAQVIVRDEQCDIATLVDAVFVNKNGRVVVVELKTGFEGYNESHNGRMRAEFSHLTNSPANQHRVQLAFTHAMFQRTFPEFGEAGALLIRMTSSGAHVTSLGAKDKKAAQKARGNSLAR